MTGTCRKGSDAAVRNAKGHSRRRPIDPVQHDNPYATDHRGVDSEVDAGEDPAPKFGRQQKITLDAISTAGPAGLAADEAAPWVGLDGWSIQPRVSELMTKGLIVDGDLRRRNCTGKRAICWVVDEFAMAMAA